MKPNKPSSAPQAAAPSFFSPQVSAAKRFYLDMNPRPRKAIAVVCGGYEQCTPDYTVRRRTFPFFSIEFVARGSAQLSLNGRDLPLQAGSVFSYGPGVPHYILARPANPPLKYFVDFCGPGSKEFLKSCGLPCGSETTILPPADIQILFDELIRSGLRASRQTPALCVALLQSLGLRIAEARKPTEEITGLAFATFQRCRDHIQTHFKELNTLHQIASRCHVDPAYLCRLFRRYDHQSPYQLLLRLKMNWAADCLRVPGALVKQAAETVGFSDPFHFSRTFKAVLGLAPETFRRLR